jgi:Glycosyl hydrolases family 2, sugar binding domain/Glycosyl hydrolases family 2/Glycosyl hydrolases family 2, TIM barrel domain
MVRSNWQNLNGLWDYAVTVETSPTPSHYAGQILVPYPIESALSGVKRPLRSYQRLWYRRTFSVRLGTASERTLLHFGAVDYEATVYVNGRAVGTHSGGYQSFTYDITDALKNGENDLVVKVYDPTSKGPNPHGKQSQHPEWMTYTASSGIWQTVWLETVPATYIEHLTLTADVDRSELHIEVELQGKREGYTIEAVARRGSEVVARQTFNDVTELHIGNPSLWSPDDPYLYDLEVDLRKDGRVTDTVGSYFGFRKIEVRKDTGGNARIYLNGRYTYNLGVADQGFWPDGLYTAPTDAALKFDLQAIKALGFNTVREHVKIESERWYTYCDRLGLMVLQDMPSSNNDTPEARAEFESEVKSNVAELHNHPSITTWVLFNEGWGAYDQERLARFVKQVDPSRLLNVHSGPYDQIQLAQYLKRMKPSQLPGPLGGDTTNLSDEGQRLQYHAPGRWLWGDIADLHFYPGPKIPPAPEDMARVTGEWGSFGVFVEGHVWDELQPVGGGVGGWAMTPAQMLDAYANSMQKLKRLEAQGLSGSNYFELFDVEGEQQGFLTYDREYSKVPVAEIERLNARIVPRAKNYTSATAGFAVMAADASPEPQRYAGLLSEYRNGRRDLPFLKRLALMAFRQNDQAQGTEVGNGLIARLRKPYSKDAWALIAALTRTSKDSGYELLRSKGGEANAVLGPQAAEKKILEVISREAIDPYFTDKKRVPDWQTLEQSVGARYGPLGSEAVYGARMMYELVKEDWPKFGEFYARYFATAISRSGYPLHTLSYQVLENVNDSRALTTAIHVMNHYLDADKEIPVLRHYDPTALDTYANLLYKVGRKKDALAWEQKAVRLSEGYDREIAGHFHEMQMGKPTWR